MLNKADICERLLELAHELQSHGEMADAVAGILYTTGYAIIEDSFETWQAYCGIYAMAECYRKEREEER